MRDKLDNILLSILWLVASALAACFWFNIRFGFNIFSSQHWHHLAYMQAVQNPVAPSFYISMVVAVIIIILGLYLLIRPRFRKFKLPMRHTTTTTYSSTSQTPQPTPPVQHADIAPSPIESPISAPTLSRPPRLNIAVTPTLHSVPTPAPQPTTQSQPNGDWPEIREIFESAGYTIKQNPRIGALQTTLFAIGTNETLWVGAVGIPTTALQSAIDTLNQIFSDTLDDIYIHVNGFVISAPDATTPGAPEILTFDTPNALRQYMNEHRNPPLGENDNGNFDAFSAYISTVIDYVGKI